MQQSPKQLLKEIFGYENFRPQQEEIVDHALACNDSLVIMPTGGGKSLCYQLPALVMEGTALVISPLIALMQDQVDALKANGVQAATLNSATTLTEIREIEQQLYAKTLKLLYVSPERAVTPKFIRFARSQPVNLIAIDEAHCVSVWGNDFRPEYTRLPELMQHFEGIPFLALTATADKATQKDIAEKLALRNPRFFLSSFERKNLNLRVLPASRRLDFIVDYVQKHKNDSGIIYCLSRKSTEKVAEKLKTAGVEAEYYHAELSASRRQQVQQAFQRDEIKVICATIAFGMGIDKPNIRYVLHYNLPKNLESYYQEIGRAGRDGLPAETLLFFSMGDGQILRKFIDESEADEQFKQVQRSKLGRMFEFGLATSCRTNMILSYFGEHRTEGCGHCDNCRRPPRSFDGTILAQKALSAVVRTREQASINLLADILRGSERSEILRQGFHHIKTFGAGKDVKRDDWLSYLSQLVNQGFLEVDFTDYNKLKVTEIGKLVLFGKHKIKLTEPRQAAPQEVPGPQKSKIAVFEEGLFQHLRELRLRLAREEKVPPYVVFNDATLQDMAAAKPMHLAELSEVSGVGKSKLERYGQQFLNAIKEYVLKQEGPKNLKGKTYLQTLSLWKQGHTPEQIAEKRNLNPLTIYSHLAYLYEKGEPVPVTDYILAEEVEEIGQQWEKLNRPEELKGLFEALGGKQPFYKLRLAIAFLKKRQNL